MDALTHLTRLAVLLGCLGGCLSLNDDPPCGAAGAPCPGSPDGPVLPPWIGRDADAASPADAAACPAGQQLCANVCRTSTDPQHCGPGCVRCPIPAGGEATCDGMNCGSRCPSGTKFCAPQAACLPDAQACDTRCTPGTKRCSGAMLETCRTDGSRHDVTMCPQGCTDGTGCNVCQPGARRCASTGLQETCRQDGSGWAASMCPKPDNGSITCDPDGSCGAACDFRFRRCKGTPATCGRILWEFNDGLAGINDDEGRATIGTPPYDGNQALSVTAQLNDANRYKYLRVTVPLCPSGLDVAGLRASARVRVEGPALEKQPRVHLYADLGGGNRVETSTISFPVGDWASINLSGVEGATWYRMVLTIEVSADVQEPWNGTIFVDDIRID